MPKPKRGLGKGLEALFADNETADVAVRSLSIHEIEPNADQPRRDFDPVALNELAASITQHGVLTPILVRPRPNGRYEIVAGERRWRASRIAGLSEIPVVVRELSDSEAYQMALVENLIREDLNPVEEALGYQTLAEEYELTQEQIAEKVGRSRPAIANALRLLSLPEEIVTLLKKGSISAGHARALLPLEEKDSIALAKRIVAEDLSVRHTEQLAKLLKKEPVAKAPPKKTPAFYREMELALKETLSRKVRVSHKGEDKGELVIEFYSREELEDFANKLAGK